MKPNSQRATNAIYSLYSTILGSTLLIAMGIYTFLLLTNPSYQFQTMDEYNSYLTLAAIVGIVYFVLYIICAVLFIMWFRRAYFNLHSVVRSSSLKYTEGWAAGAWFVPIFNLWAPYQIATDLFSKSEAILMKHNLIESKPNFHLVKNWWWGLWIAAGVFSRVASRMDDIESVVVLGTILAIIGAFLSILAAIVAVKMIRNYSQMEPLLMQVPKDGSRATEMLITDDDLLDSGI